MSAAGRKRSVQLAVEEWPIRGVFRIARGAKTTAEVVVVAITQNGCRGRGEAYPAGRYGQTVESVTAQIEDLRFALEKGLNRTDLHHALAAGSARNAIDCALWDLEAKLAGRPAWQLAGLESLHAVQTAFTLSLDEPARMQAAARLNARRPLLKVKLTGRSDIERVAAVRSGAPRARLIVDANESWSPEYYSKAAPELARRGVELIEQPFPADADQALSRLERPVPICADESCHDRAGLEALVGRYDVVNIKLDKTGGLTEALCLEQKARRLGFGIMVGCMVSTSLAIAPALLVAQAADFVDLDGALLLEKDRPYALAYRNHGLEAPLPELWG